MNIKECVLFKIILLIQMKAMMKVVGTIWQLLTYLDPAAVMLASHSQLASINITDKMRQA